MRRLRRAIVVGGAGFFGSWILDALAESGIPTTVLDPRAQGSDDSVVVAANVQSATFSNVLAELDADVLFHLAGTGLVPVSLDHPHSDLENNAGTVLAVLEAARLLPTPPLVVFVSSAAVYGEARTIPMRKDHPLEPVSPYGVSKLAGEHYVRLYTHLYGIPSFSVRPFSLYGPRQQKLVVYDLLARIFAGENPLRVGAAATISRDFVFVEDAARALVTLAGTAPAVGEAYNIASERSTTLQELVELLLEQAGLGGGCEFTGSARVGDPLRWCGDAELARSLGATFETPLEVGLQRTVAWFKAMQERTQEAAWT